MPDAVDFDEVEMGQAVDAAPVDHAIQFRNILSAIGGHVAFGELVFAGDLVEHLRIGRKIVRGPEDEIEPLPRCV